MGITIPRQWTTVTVKGQGSRRSREMSSSPVPKDNEKGAPSTAGRGSHTPVPICSQPVNSPHQPPVTCRTSPARARNAESVPRRDPEALSLREGKSSAAGGGSVLASHVTSNPTPLPLPRHAASLRRESLRIPWIAVVPRFRKSVTFFYSMTGLYKLQYRKGG